MIKKFGKKNMHELELVGLRLLYSYKTLVAFTDSEHSTTYITEKKWSVTTTRHINHWLTTIEPGVILSIKQEELDSMHRNVKNGEIHIPYMVDGKPRFESLILD